MKYRLTHTTRFTYSQPVTFVYNALHLTPRDLPWQGVEDFVLTTIPEPAVLNHRPDYFGNIATYFTVEEPHGDMTITARSCVDVRERGTRAGDGLPWDRVKAALQADQQPAGLEAYQYCFASPEVPLSAAASDYVRPSAANGRPVDHVARDLMHRIVKDFTFDATATTVSTPVDEVLVSRRGVCQDFAHLMICCLRTLGLAARYYSGYIQTHPAPGEARLQGADASHAWVGVYCPGAGWVELDPTNDQDVDSQYITLGWGRDFRDVSPAKGVLLGGGEHTVDVSVDMLPESEWGTDPHFLQQQQAQQQQ